MVTKAMLRDLYLPGYPGLQVEVPIGYRYKPDLVLTGADDPLFRLETGRIGS